GPARKVLGDIRLRQGRPADAMREYEASLAASAPVYQRFVRAAMANAALAQRDTARARRLFAQAQPGASPTLTAVIRRGLGQAALIDGRPDEALALFAEAAAQPSGPDRAYHRVWALEGAARAHLTLGDRAAALDAYRQAMAGAEQVRARFRSEEFKAGFFG